MSLLTLTASETQIATTNVNINNTIIIYSFLKSLIRYPIMSLRRYKSTIVCVHRQDFKAKNPEKQAFH
jgi:hypothetical protein